MQATKASGDAWYLPLRPVFRMTPPQELSGVDGRNRAPSEILKIPAASDLVAAQAYMQTATHRYRSTTEQALRAIDRLFLWAWICKSKPVSSLLYPDFVEFWEFCKNPQPQDFWCTNRNRPSSDNWKPFSKARGDRVQQPANYMVRGISRMFDYWVTNGYIVGNPIADALDGIQPRKRVKVYASLPNLFDVHDWNALQLALATLPSDTSRQRFFAERARFLFALLRFLGLTVTEVIEGKMNFFRQEGGIWLWRLPITGSRARPLKAAVPDEMIDSLSRYRTHCGMSPLPDRSDTNPLFVSIPKMVVGDFSSEGIKTNALYQIIAAVAASAADLLSIEMSHKAEALRSITYTSVLELALRYRDTA